MKHDIYLKRRGGKAFLIWLYCICGERILRYQKDGDGPLKRCYLNRILSPQELEELQYDAKNSDPKNVPRLTCKKCQTVIGAAITHHDGRVAFRLRPGFFFKKRDTSSKKGEKE